MLSPAPRPDEGKSLKFTDAELALAISNLSTASSTIDCIVTPLLVCLDGRPLASDESSNLSMPLPDTVPAPSKRAVKGHTAHVLVRKRSLNPADATEIRIAVVGNVDAGKSTLLGVLTKDVLDDGRGKARVNLFKHKHEIETGRTSSVGLEIMGFDECGRTVTPALLGRARPDWQDIGTASSKVISFHDLAGHEKYLKTTVFGMSGSDPHFAMLMIGANAGMVGMTKEHLGLALCLNLPVFVVVTKIDMCPPNVLESTLRTLTKVLKSSGCRKIPMAVRTMEESLSVAGNFVGERVCPIFQVSNVTGEGLPILRAFLNAIRAPGARGRYDPAKPVEFTITDLFSVPGVGTVVSGTLLSGVISAGDTVVIGPDSTGNFMTTQVKSVQRKRCVC